MKTHSLQISRAFLNWMLLAVTTIGALAALPASASVDYWNDGSGNWSAGGNWLSGTTPNPYDTLQFINLSGGTYTPNDDLANGTPIDGIVFTNSTGSFTLGGNSILISGQTNGFNANIGVTNTTSLAETVNNNLTLDWGYYTFNSPSATLALNGSIAANLGGVADFGSANVTSSSYAVDGTGLIQGLGGAGLIGNNGLGANSGGGFSALATVSGGAVVPYTYPAAAVLSAAGAMGGTTPSTASNLEITVTGSANFSLAGGTSTTYGANNTYINTILENINTTTKNTGIDIPSGNGTLVLGTNEGNIYIGGIYVPGGQTAQEITIGGGTSCYLTCGPMTAGNPIPGEIIIAVNGNNTSNEGEMNAAIEDNLGGGHVSVVYTGGGSDYINNLGNTYSGGTYMIKGRVQCNQTNALGVGPVYISSGDAEISLQNAGNGDMPNNFFISPGSSYVGAQTEGAIRLQGTGSTGFIMSGNISLAGPPVTPGFYATGTNWPSGAPAVADRISDQSADKSTFGGQFTGPGTLELYAGASGITFWMSNNTANANNWTGGLVIDGAVNDSCDVKLLANNQVAGNNLTPIASGTGFARLDLSGFNDMIGALNSISNSLLNNVSDFGPAASTLFIGTNNASGSFYGTISDNGNANDLSIVKIGTGTLTLSGVNSYVGSTYVNGGSLILTGTANINSSAAVAVSGATLDETGLASSTGTNAIFGLTNAVWNIDIAQGGLTNRATATLNVGGTTNVVNVSTLPLITSYPSKLHLISFQNVLAATNIGVGTLPVVSPAFAGFITNENGFIDLVLTTGPAPSRQIHWLGTDANNPNNWDVQTSFNWATNGNNVPTTYNQDDFVTFNDSAPGQTNINVTTTVTPGGLTVSNTVLQYEFSGSGTISNSTAGSINLLKQGNNLLILDENNIYTGSTIISNGTVQVGAGNGIGSVGTGPIINNASLVYNIYNSSGTVVSNNISGTGSFTQAGGDIVQLSGANTYTGNIVVTNNSILQLGSYTALGSGVSAGTATTTVANGSSIDINGYTIYGSIIAQGSGANGEGAIMNSSPDIAGTQAPAAVQYVGLTNLTLSGNITIDVNGNRFDLRSPAGTGGNPGTAFLSTGGQPYNITKIGHAGASGGGFFGVCSVTVDPALANIDVQDGIFEFEGNSTSLGNPTNSVIIEGNSFAGGTLGSFQLYDVTNRLNKVIVLNDGGTLWNASGNNTIIGTIDVTNSSGDNPADCNVEPAGGSLSLVGPLIGNGTLYEEIGTNEVILSGNSVNFAGGVEAHTGTMIISNVLNAPLGVQVDGAASLSVAGFIATNVVDDGFLTGSGVVSNLLDVYGTVEPGTASTPQTLTAGGFIWESGSTVNVNFNSVNTVGGGVNDLIAVNGNVNIAGGCTLNVLPVGLLEDGVPYTVMTFSGSLSGSVSSINVPSIDGYTLTVSSTAHAITVTASGGPPVWTGDSATDSDWSDAANWSVSPTSGEPIYFAGGNRIVNTNDIIGGSYTSITFAPGAGLFALDGTNAVTLTGTVTILNDSANAQTVNLPIDVAANQTFNGANAPLDILGGLTNTTAAFTTVTLAGQGILSDQIGDITGGTNVLVLNSTSVNWTIVNNAAGAPITAPCSIEVYAGTLNYGTATSAPNFTSTTPNGTPNDTLLGQNAGQVAELNMTNGVLVLDSRLDTGANIATSTGIVNQVGGTITINGQLQGANIGNGVSYLNISGGTNNVVGNTLFVASRGIGYLNISGSGVVNVSGAVDVSRDAQGTSISSFGTVNLNGGTLSCTSIGTATANSATGASPGATGTFNFNGGTLVAGAGAAATFISDSSGDPVPLALYVLGGGAIINDGGQSIAVNEEVQSGAANDGGLTKFGAGTLTLNKTNTYNGPTTISAGTLVLDDLDPSNSAPVTIAGGAVFNVHAIASGFTLVSGQLLTNNASASTATVVGNFNASAGKLGLTYTAGTPSLTETNGTFTLAAGTALAINNTGTALGGGTYIIIAAGPGGTVSGALPSSYTITGGGVVAGASTSLSFSGGALVLTVSLPTSPAIFTGISVSGTTLSFSATNGAPNGTYTLLESTNILIPVSQWTPVFTNSFNASGNISLSTNVVNPNGPQEFYILQMP